MLVGEEQRGQGASKKKRSVIPDNLQQGLPKRVSQRGRRSHVDFRTVGDRYVSGPPTSATRRPGWIGTGESYRNTYVQYIISSLLQRVLRGEDRLTDEGSTGALTLHKGPCCQAAVRHVPTPSPQLIPAVSALFDVLEASICQAPQPICLASSTTRVAYMPMCASKAYTQYFTTVQVL